jgi:uncharacterized membrane protein YfcA
MTIELIVIGSLIGVLSGFFGIGGGAILVPALLMLGFDIKSAVGISVFAWTRHQCKHLPDPYFRIRCWYIPS